MQGLWPPLRRVKGVSLKQPSAAVLQSFALFSASKRICLKLAHVAGERYGEAVKFSRGQKLGGIDIAKA